ncbi:unnamed protein product, partial [Nesidiocoris tenuis]
MLSPYWPSPGALLPIRLLLNRSSFKVPADLHPASSAAVECQKNDSQPRKVPPHAQSAVGRAKGEGDENEGRDELKKRRGRHAAAVGAHRLFHCH